LTGGIGIKMPIGLFFQPHGIGVEQESIGIGSHFARRECHKITGGKGTASITLIQKGTFSVRVGFVALKNEAGGINAKGHLAFDGSFQGLTLSGKLINQADALGGTQTVRAVAAIQDIVYLFLFENKKMNNNRN